MIIYYVNPDKSEVSGLNAYVNKNSISRQYQQPLTASTSHQYQ